MYTPVATPTETPTQAPTGTPVVTPTETPAQAPENKDDTDTNTGDDVTGNQNTKSEEKVTTVTNEDGTTASMQKHIKKLAESQSDSLVQTFLQSFGERIKFRRKRVNVSQDELAACLDIDASTLSKYESGTRDMQVSLLPLVSVYCDFPMYELFPREESQVSLMYSHEP